MRKASITRNTTETQIQLNIDIDGTGQYQIDTGCGFLNHMLELFARHARFDLDITCAGDVQVDYHHTTEDVGIVLGKAISQALGEKRGIVRYGSFLLPMDETLVLSAVDISGRAYANCPLTLQPTVGSFDTELVPEFFWAVARSANMTIHFQQMAGSNTHHIIEAAFKGFARAMRQAVAIEKEYADEIPSTKGVL